MATMIKVNKENEGKSKELTPEYIQGKLFSFSNTAHKFHLDTKSFAEHSALGSFYKALVDYMDYISEKLMGYMNGKRVGEISLDKIPSYSHEAAVKLAKEVGEFAYEVYEWAEEKRYCDIENIAQSLSGDAMKTVYLLTLS